MVRRQTVNSVPKEKERYFAKCYSAFSSTNTSADCNAKFILIKMCKTQGTLLWKWHNVQKTLRHSFPKLEPNNVKNIIKLMALSDSKWTLGFSSFSSQKLQNLLLIRKDLKGFVCPSFSIWRCSRCFGRTFVCFVFLIRDRILMKCLNLLCGMESKYFISC